jgi:hypothetical protein
MKNSINIIRDRRIVIDSFIGWFKIEKERYRGEFVSKNLLGKNSNLG